MDDKMEGSAWSRRSSSNDEGKYREAMAMACSFLQVDGVYPDQEKALITFLKEVIFSSARTQSIRPIIKLEGKCDQFTK